ncbi:MAG TPA: 2-oxoacid:acceptor oxidoreductase subunit alpha [Candidatus Polarisedimenticolaceae bacterium]|nr:2-oxoacid:acceptor oxidoreductase subunit alpha [Candidatus Polarisedimenticolaceae bacterium]
MDTTSTTRQKEPVETLSRVVIRFAGDSGDGMQLTGTQFTATAAAIGNDLATFPDYPAEIRAPAGTLAGVSGFQVNFSSEDIFTPGDAPDVLVAMNPAALKANVKDLRPGGILIVNTDSFRDSDLTKAGYAKSPLTDGSLAAFQVHEVDITKLTRAALKETGLPQRIQDKCRNFFALGMMYYLYHRPMDVSMHWIEQKFGKKPELVEANKLALKGGYAYCEATEIFQVTYEVPKAKLEPGTYRNISGNQALCLGFVAAAQKAGRPMFLGSYPITPASDILHEMSNYKNFGIVTFQAEDEIAAIGSALGAAFAGDIGLTTTSGPGMALKMEFIGLAIMVELPLVIVDIQRGGPSTGLPTKTEQADLLQAMFGRPSEAPCIVIAARSSSDCFDVAYEAVRLAMKHMTPVILLSDGYIANGAEPWKLPKIDALPAIDVRLHTEATGFLPYARDPETLARPWAVPGTPGLEHRIGGIEKSNGTGNISYEPANHEAMVHLRADKVARVANEIPPCNVEGDPDGLLVLGWGSTFGAITGAVRRGRAEGRRVGHLHLRYLNPMPADLGEVLARYDTILLPEMNLGQLAMLIRAKFLRDVVQLNKVQGQPFKESEILAKIQDLAPAKEGVRA